MVHDLMLVQVKKPEDSKYPVGLLPDSHAYPGRAGVRAAQSGLPSGQAVIAATRRCARLGTSRHIAERVRGAAPHPPRVAEFDLEAAESAEFLDDPYPTYRALRQFDPVHRMPDGSYFLTRYDDCLAVYRDAGHLEFGQDSSISGRILPTACSTSITRPASSSTIRPITRGCASCWRPPSRRGPCAHCSRASRRSSTACWKAPPRAARSISSPISPRRFRCSSSATCSAFRRTSAVRCAAGRSPSSARSSRC